MADSFERLTTGITGIYKSIRKIKRLRMDSIGLKGTHVMCIYYLYTNPEGLTGTDLCQKCREDKSGISRILSDLEEEGLICYRNPGDGRRYRARAILTEKGLACGAKVRRLIEHAVIAGGSGIDDEEREIFYKVLFTISDNLEKLSRKLEETNKL